MSLLFFSYSVTYMCVCVKCVVLYIKLEFISLQTCILILLMLLRYNPVSCNFVQIVPALTLGALSGQLQCPFDFPASFSLCITLWYHKMPQAGTSCLFPVLALELAFFFKETCFLFLFWVFCLVFLFFKEWYLETKIWALSELITIGCLSFYLSQHFLF